MNIRLRHIAELTIDDVMACYAAAERNGVAAVTFYDGAIKSAAAFYLFLRDCDAWFVRLDDERGKPAGCFWLNGYQGKTAAIHFMTFHDSGVDPLLLGRLSLRYVFKNTDLASLWGCTPRPYRHALRYVGHLGFKVLGQIPAACFIERKNKHVDGVISVIEAGEYRHG
jgi:hypothetical protein